LLFDCADRRAYTIFAGKSRVQSIIHLAESGKEDLMETWRRGILLAGVVLALAMAKFAVLKPLLSLQAVDFAKEQAGERAWTDEGTRLKGLPLLEYVAAKTKDAMVSVSGQEWDAVFAGLRAADANEAGARVWLERAPADERRWGFSGKWFFFRPSESPVAAIAGRLSADADRLTLEFHRDGEVEYWRAELHIFSSGDFHFGSGFSHSPKPPASFLFPFRKYSLLLVLLGLALYILLPRRRKEKGAIFYPAWRIGLGDFASFLLIVPFFAMPLLIVGGTVQALTQGWMLGLVFWPLALLGVWLLRIMAWYAGYEVDLRRDGVFIRDGHHERMIPFSELAHYRPLDLRPPRWLVWAGLLAAVSGRGSARVGAAGRGLLLAGFSNGGVGLGLKKGSSVFFWITDAMGTTALKNSKKLLPALDRAGVPRLDEVQEIRSVAPPTGQDASGKILKEGHEAVVWILAGLPIAAMLVFFFLVMFGRPF
jgi:hypothetical protein